MVVSANEIASRAGMEVLRAGGNAVSGSDFTGSNATSGSVIGAGSPGEK